MSWVKRLEYSKQDKSFRDSYHSVALLEKEGSLCYEPLGLPLLIG